MKNSLRATSLFLILASLLCTASCGGGTTEPVDTTAPDPQTTAGSETTSLLDSLDSKNFEGRDFVVYDGNYSKGLQVNFPGEEANGEIVNDALIDRDRAISEKYNVNIRYFAAQNVDTLKNSVIAGDNEYNLAFSTIYTLHTLASSDVLADLNELDPVTPDAAWWSPLIADRLSLNNHLYYTAGDIAPSIYQAPLCMFLNLDLYDDYGYKTDLFQLTLDGKWTLDVLADLTKDLNQDLNGDNAFKPADDFFGIGMQPTAEAVDAFFGGANISICQLSADKKELTLSAFGDRDVSAIEKIISVCTKIPYEDVNDIINLNFKVGKSLFLQHKLESAATHLRDMKSDYLILPMPKYDENDGYISCVSGYVSSFTAVPKNDDPEFSGFITEALARWSHESLRPLAYDVVYKQKNTRDERSAEILNILFDTLYIEFGTVGSFADIRIVLRDVIFDQKPIASSIEGVRTAANEQMKKFAAEW